ncbi:MAG: hypothetical protein R3350_06435 [Saprospiraceae bacterium]|nr:hypothetical protein [Saprospiraceae bacterium]
MISNRKLKELSKARYDHCVSIYLPIQESADVHKRKEKFKELLTRAEDRLKERGVDKRDVHKMLFDAYELLEDEQFWTQEGYGVAVFVSEEPLQHFELPADWDERLVVGDRYYLKPLMPVVSGNKRFFLLALRENAPASLYEGNRYRLRPLHLAHLVPSGVEEALELESADRELLHPSNQPSFDTPIFRGDRLGSDHHLKELKRYFVQIDAGVMKLLDDERAPLVLAGPDQYIPLYREVNSYLDSPQIHVSGDVDRFDEDDLHEKALEIVDEFYVSRRAVAKEGFDKRLESENASTSIFEIIPTAKSGKIESLFLQSGTHQWGRYDEKTDSIELHDEKQPDSIDLTDLAAVEAHLHGATVYLVEKGQMPMPGEKINATFKVE